MPLRFPRGGSRTRARRLLALMLAVDLIVAPLTAQVVTPTSVAPTCEGFPVSIALPNTAVTNSVDVFFLFDDTSSFESWFPNVTTIFGGLVNDLEAALPGVSFGFGVGRFEDFGGPGSGFSTSDVTSRPFILSQPIVTADDAGSAGARDTLIEAALARTTPGSNSDPAESGIEALFQVATGAGFDGNGNSSRLDSGNAGDTTTQLTPGTSGDVPPFSSNVLLKSGNLGGVGWRADALHLVILATDVWPVSAFPTTSPIPSAITGVGGVTVPTTAFALSSTNPVVGATNRFGYISDALTVADNTVIDSATNKRTAVAPKGAASVQEAVSALNALGIRVISMGPDVVATDAVGPSPDPSVWLSALARLTGAVDEFGSPLVFDIGISSEDLEGLSNAILSGITTTSTQPIDIALTHSALPTGLTFSSSPSVVSNVSPGGTASFNTTLAGDGTNISGGFNLNFIDNTSQQVLGTIPVLVSCVVEPPAPTTIDLSLTHTVDTSAPEVGANVTYTVAVTNALDHANATNVTVTDVLPAGVEYVSSSASQGAFDSTTGTWTIGSVVAGQSVTLTLVARATAAGTFTTLAQVQTATESDDDSTPGNAPATPEDDDASVAIAATRPEEPEEPEEPPTDHCKGKKPHGHHQGDGCIYGHHGHSDGDNCRGQKWYHHRGDGCVAGHHGHHQGDRCRGQRGTHHEGDGCLAGRHGHYDGDRCGGARGGHHDGDGCLWNRHGHRDGDACRGRGNVHHDGDGCFAGHHGHFGGDGCQGRTGFHHDDDGDGGWNAKHVYGMWRR